MMALDVDRDRLLRTFLDGSVTYWSPTSVYLTITVHGRTAHAGVEPEMGISAVQVAADAPPYREAAAATRSLGLEVIPRESGGGTDGNYIDAKGIPCVALSTGMVDEHATSEHIAVDDLVLAAGTLVAIATLHRPTPEEEAS